MSKLVIFDYRRITCIVFASMFCCWVLAARADEVAGGACTTGYTAGPNASGEILKCVGSVWTVVSGGGGGGLSATDRISTTNVSSGATLGMVVADKGTVSFTLGGTAGAAYLHPTLGFVGPGVSTTGGISGTTGYFSGNVGIGTSNPTEQLTLKGVGPNIGLYDTTSGATNTIQNSSGGLIFNTGGGNSIIFQLGGSEKMRVNTSTGNVGISTTNPNAKLAVNGAPLVVNDDSKRLDLYGYYAELQVSGVEGAAITRYTNDAYGPVLALQKNRSGGVSSHSAAQAGDQMGRVVFGASDGSAFRSGPSIDAVTSVAPGTGAAPGSLRFTFPISTASNSPLIAMVIDPSGSVGIGTSSPTSKLHVSGGNILLDNNQNLSWKNAGGTGTAVLQLGSSDQVLLGSTALNGAVYIYNASYYSNGHNPALMVSASGNVGIGTSSPNATLHVSGTGAMIMPVGTTAQQPTCNSSMKGGIRYNSSTNTPEVCGGAAWVPFSSAVSPGTVMADGTIFAGYAADGSRIYTTRCDAGQTWDGSACTGMRLTKNWNNGSTNWTVTGFTSRTDGQANTTGLAALADAGAAYEAAVYCDGLTDSGQSDWYLPAIDELGVFYSNKTEIGGFDTSGNWYWSSSEDSNSFAWYQRFSAGNHVRGNKNNGIFYVRCARR